MFFGDLEEEDLMKIGLYGIAGTYNLGCEAIVRGTVYVFRKIFPEASFIYYSENACQDREVLKNLNIEIKQIIKRRVLIKRCVNKVLRMVGINYQFLYENYKNIINEVDCIISIGGDIYTIPRFVFKKRKYLYYNRLIHFGEKVKKRNKKLIIYGASIGPFGNRKEAQIYFANHLKKVDLIISRDKETISYLEYLGVRNNVMFMPDPAFYLSENLCKREGLNNLIGLNLSGLSIQETYGEFSEKSIIQFADIVEKIIEKTQCNILLISHVFSKNKIDNDYFVLNKIMEFVGEEYKNNINLTTSKSFLELKNEITDCRIVISARMHCAINALSEGIPTILLAYSKKAKGMGEFVYNSSKWVYDIRSLEDEKFFELIDEMLNNRKTVGGQLVDNLEKKLAFDIYSNEMKLLKRIILQDN